MNAETNPPQRRHCSSQPIQEGVTNYDFLKQYRSSYQISISVKKENATKYFAYKIFFFPTGMTGMIAPGPQLSL